MNRNIKRVRTIKANGITKSFKTNVEREHSFTRRRGSPKKRWTESAEEET